MPKVLNVNAAAAKMLTDHETVMATRMWHDIWRSPQGKDLGRFLLRELGKEHGNVGIVLNELLDIGASVARKLYCADRPVQSRQTYGDR
jgi:hypothetical protein